MQEKRKFIITMLAALASILALSGSYLLYKYYDLSRNHYVKYSENSDLDYKVFYNDNNFFHNNYLEKDNKYIASLINYISADFKYDIDFLENDINYNYDYKIIANVSVKDANDKETIYKDEETIFESPTLGGTNKTNITKNIRIDYNKYNNLISRFTNTYDLKDVDSILKVSMYVNLKSSGNTDIEDLNKKAVVSLNIPLTKKTIGIDLSSDLTKNSQRKLLIKSTTNYLPLLVIGSIELLLTLIVIIVIFVYAKKTRTIKSIYNREKRKILNNYGSYIQKINNTYKIGTSQVIKVEKFNDMLEIRDTLKTPILMLENKREDGTFFIIPATNGVIYAYALRMVDIFARKQGQEAPEYDLKNIDKALPKKYTNEFIEKQIEKTRRMKAIDIDNTIEGNKDKDSDLYDQLAKTVTMKPVKITAKEDTKKKKATKTKEETKKTTKKTTTKDAKKEPAKKTTAKKTTKKTTTKKEK